MPQLSIIIPFYNEEENVAPVLEEVLRCQPEAEVIAVDDGSRDTTADKIRGFPGVVLLSFPRNLGQSAAFYHGLHRAKGGICVMMDGDGQNDPADIDALVAALAHGDVACGYRRTRRDSFSKRLASRIANHIRKSVLGDGIRDTGCSLKALRREHVKYLVPFNAMHRFIPALLVNCGLKVVEVPVNHRHRTRGVSKYTVAGRAWRGLRDLLGVRWFMSRQIRWDLDPHRDD
ncbi:MAG: glycosyltransferase family 2 protein [Candidatus Methylacidiphilales bacterium]|nr:glycosyltransferase family 2 protein [Candidatus Methylacidiphilales bacterium]